MANIIEQSFRLNIALMRFIGVYPSQTHPTLQKVKGYILYFTLLVLVTTLVLINMVQKKDSDITLANYMWTYIAETTFCCLKLAPFIQQGVRIENCINYFGHPRFAPKDDEEEKIIKECVKVCRRNSLIYFSVLIFSYCAWIFPFIFTKQLPLDVWLPYNHRTGPMVFYSTFIFTCAAVFYDSFPGIMIDPLIGGLAYHARSQLKVLIHNLQHLEEKVMRNTYTKQDHSVVCFENAYNHLKLCVTHHNHILNFVSEYQQCFSLSVFSQISACLFLVCFSCISVILAPAGSFDFVKNLIFLFMFTGQISVYCYYGTLLYEQNEGFTEGVCMGSWYNYDVKVRKILILMMERSNRPMILTAGKIVKLTLQTFTSLLKTSYSLIAVLKNS